MADQPKQTSDILAAIRNKGGPATPPAAALAPAEPAPAQPAVEAAATPPAPAAKPAAAAGEAPKGTSSILASIRAKGGAAAGGEAKSDAPAPAKPAATGAAPKGTSSILSSIRGRGGAPAGAKPAAGAAKPAAKAAPAKPAGDRPSVQEMIKAVKEGVKAEEPGKPKLPPRLPSAKPAAKAPAGAPNRRGVFLPLWVLLLTPYYFAWAMMSVITGLLTLKTAQFMMPNMVLELPSRFKVGVSSDYPLGTVSEKYKASRGVWIVHTDAYDGRDTIYAIASVCTHLGCTPNWLEGEQKFKCPCHGSGFYISGINFEGPAPRPLERVGIRVAVDGQLEVDKSVKFQEELGQWADGKSFVELV
jgi:cytochrome b6-f complex iron-sulfur subunit